MKQNNMLTFYNITEIPDADRKHIFAIGNEHFKNRTTNELDAALGLLMLRYQPTFKLKEINNFKTPCSRILFNSKSEFVSKTIKKQKHKSARISNKLYFNDEILSEKVNHTEIRSHQNFSLLTSCRNILKEFLGENGLQ